MARHADLAAPSWSDGERLPEETWPDTRALPRSFFGAPLCTDPGELQSDVAFLGVPFDQGGRIPGARFGPNGIRDADVYSCAGLGYAGGAAALPAGYYDIDTDRQHLAGVTMADCGDVIILPSDVERNFWRITRAVRTMVARGPLVVVVGGDHSITAATVRGFDAHEAVDVVHFDAHLDFLDGAQGIRWSNGCPIRRVSEYPWVRNITQVGMRATKTREPYDAALARGNRIVTSDRFRELGPEEAMATVPESDAIYVTMDVDVLDPTICPGTAAPEPGGLTYLEMRAALRALARRGRIVGIDVVEVSPPLDPRGLTAKTAAQLLVDLLTAMEAEGQLPIRQR